MFLSAFFFLAPISGLAAESVNAAEALEGSQWQLVEIQSMDDAVGSRRPAPGVPYTMNLGADGSVSMELNCNRAMGQWNASSEGSSNSGSFRFGPLAGTRALCPPPSLDEEVLAQAGYVRSFLLENGRLYLSLMADGGILVWQPLSSSTEVAAAANSTPQSPEPDGPRNWQVQLTEGRLNLRRAPSLGSAIVAQFADSTLLDNLGCLESEGRSWCDVQQLGGGPRGYVAADFLQAAVGPDGRVPMGADDSALRAGQGDFDAQGQIPCASEIGQPARMCDYRVSRGTGGYATVVVSLPEGSERILFFSLGIPIGASSSEASPGGEFRFEKESDLNLIRLGNERYEIPDAVVLGG